MPDTQGSGVFELSPARVSRAYDRMMAHRHTLAAPCRPVASGASPALSI